MNWTAFLNFKYFFDFVVGFTTIIGFLSGIYLYFYEKKDRLFREQLGSTYFDKDSLGYFVTERSFFLPFLSPPKTYLPDVAGLIAAGDDGVYTSSMFAWILPGYQQVSWKVLYEAFFREYAWECDRIGEANIGDWSDISPNKKKPFDRFKQKGLEAIKLKKQEAEGKPVKKQDDHQVRRISMTYKCVTRLTKLEPTVLLEGSEIFSEPVHNNRSGRRNITLPRRQC